MQLTNNAKEDIESLKKSGDKGLLKKFAVFLEELTEHPRERTGQPEELKYEFAGCWSRKINNKHRLVYLIDEKQMVVIILQAYRHYKDK